MAVKNRTVEKLKSSQQKNKKKLRWLRTRMWISVLISHFFPDRGTVPSNIGDNILISNNRYITKNNLCAFIHVKEMSTDTPIGWTGELVKYVKSSVKGVVIDIIIKGRRYHPDITRSGMGSRENAWKATLDNPYMPKSSVERAARCLYSLDVARTGEPLIKARTYIRLKAPDNRKLVQAIDYTQGYLAKIGAEYKYIQSNLEEHVEYVSLVSDKQPAHLKDIASMVYSSQTLAESLPLIQGMNNTKGLYVGMSEEDYPYYIDVKGSSNAKNIMIEADSGYGKSYFAGYLLYPAWAEDFNICIMDIKGNEFTAFTKAVNGLILSMRNTSTTYINTFVWRPQNVIDGDSFTYANEMLRLSKEQMLILSDVDESQKPQAEALLEEFLNSLYRINGIMASNENTWYRSESFNPYTVYDAFCSYLSIEVLQKYGEVAERIYEQLSISMSRSGSKSHMFRDPLDYMAILKNKCITFDFGILENSISQDRVMFKIHLLYMSIINSAFVSYKKRCGEWTLKVLEESQIVDDFISSIYTKEMTLRRSQNQVTILLGNSIAALADNPVSRPMIENINILILGRLTKSSQRFLIEEYGLTDMQANILLNLQQSTVRRHNFLIVNKMEDNATTAIVRAAAPKSVSNSSLFKVVDTVEE